MSPSTKVYLILILVLSLCAAASVYLPMGQLVQLTAEQELPASKPVLALASAAIMVVVYGCLGYLGMVLSRKLGFADVWDERLSNRQRLMMPFIIGCALGLFLIPADEVFQQFHPLGRLPHPPFPTSLVASLAAGIGEELLFRLFFVSLWTWLIARVVLKGQYVNRVFWVATFVSALLFAGTHFMSLTYVLKLNTISDIPIALLIEVIVLNGVIGIICAYYLRKYGFVAAAGIHFWTDVIWHVLWGGLTMHIA